jgi:rhamnogalacturonyl hydrolase YesR
MNPLKSALLGTDWYVNTQVINQKPWWENNHGRFIYTRHMPTGNTVLGIIWTQARGILCCLSAYERTKKKKYLETAERAAEYILGLQIMDRRDPRFFGAFHEEIYASTVSNIRDAAEGALALVFLYRTTKKREYLYRAELWTRWWLKYAVDKEGYPAGYYNLLTGKSSRSTYSFSGACAMVLFAIHKATGRAEYKAAFKKMVETYVRRFVRKKDGVILSGTFMTHHSGKGAEAGVALNDDGGGVTILQAYKLLKDKKYLGLSLQYGDYILRQNLPYQFYSAHPSRFNFLMDLAHVSGKEKYSDFVRKNIRHLLKLQYLNKEEPKHHGAFRGEDETPEWYAPKGSKGIDFINNRMTCYSVLTLFKMDGKIIGPYYSALGW